MTGSSRLSVVQIELGGHRGVDVARGILADEAVHVRSTPRSRDASRARARCAPDEELVRQLAAFGEEEPVVLAVDEGDRHPQPLDVVEVVVVAVQADGVVRAEDLRDVA